MFNKILVANRGEIAVRVIRACREMGIATVAVYSKADSEALHTHMADEAICVGSASAKESYLDVQNILSAAIVTGSEAIHPGFGFLSENARFAKVITDCGITFIGPSPDAIECMGDKAKARETVKIANVPVIPGSDGVLDSLDEALKLAENIGYPVMLKASAGGGGRGIRIVNSQEEMERAFMSAKAESSASFADDSLYMEKVITDARHIEFQILGDNYGNIIHLGERDCSMQRRNQKVLEEAPSVALNRTLRTRMGNAAIRAASAVNYSGAGTVEFLLDRDGKFYFMEMNTRIQVEHPITEMITGIDIVREQIRIAAGMPLELRQGEVRLKGHSIECRINAENPKNNFLPDCDKITMLHIPGGPGTRFDGAIYQDYDVPPHYDSMLGKLIVHAPTREEAIMRMKRALTELVIEGPETNIDFHIELLQHEEFLNGSYDTSFIGRLMAKK